MPISKGRDIEFQAFVQARASVESPADRYGFSAQRDAVKTPYVKANDTPRPIKNVAIIGAGVMGRGIALACANAGRIALVESYTDLATCTLAIEAVVERMDVKRDVFENLDRVLPAGAIPCRRRRKPCPSRCCTGKLGHGDGATGMNIPRQAALAAGLGVDVPGLTVNRFCSSSLQSIALAAQRIMAGEADIFVAGGVESISCVANEMNMHFMEDQQLKKDKPAVYWPMLRTAETVADRYGTVREEQDAYGLRSQTLAAKAAASGAFDDEIVPITVTASVTDRKTGETLRRTAAL